MEILGGRVRLLFEVGSTSTVVFALAAILVGHFIKRLFRLG